MKANQLRIIIKALRLYINIHNFVSDDLTEKPWDKLEAAQALSDMKEKLKILENITSNFGGENDNNI